MLSYIQTVSQIIKISMKIEEKINMMFLSELYAKNNMLRGKEKVLVKN